MPLGSISLVRRSGRWAAPSQPRRGRRRPVVNPQFRVDVLEVFVDRPDAHPKVRGDLVVGPTGGEQVEDLNLAAGEPACVERRRVPGRPFVDDDVMRWSLRADGRMRR